jgi:hypothetical protein
MLGRTCLCAFASFQTAKSDGTRENNARSLHVVAGFVCFALGFNAVSGLMHRKLPAYLLSSA